MPSSKAGRRSPPPASSQPKSSGNHEARYAVEYFKQTGIVCRELGFEFRVRGSTRHNQGSPDFGNALMNYLYALLKTYVRRAINSIGLDNSIPFLHEMRRNTGLVYDLMELWRTNADYSLSLVDPRRVSSDAITCYMKQRPGHDPMIYTAEDRMSPDSAFHEFAHHLHATLLKGRLTSKANEHFADAYAEAMVRIWESV